MLPKAVAVPYAAYKVLVMSPVKLFVALNTTQIAPEMPQNT